MKKNKKDYIRLSLYFIATGFILFFISEIYQTANNIDNIKPVNNNIYDLGSQLQLQNEDINLNDKLGGQILKISIAIINIIFLAQFMVILFIYEMYNKNVR